MRHQAAAAASAAWPQLADTADRSLTGVPHGARSPPHGQASSPARNRRSTSSKSVPTMTTGASISTKERPSRPAKDWEGRCASPTSSGCRRTPTRGHPQAAPAIVIAHSVATRLHRRHAGCRSTPVPRRGSRCQGRSKVFSRRRQQGEADGLRSGCRPRHCQRGAAQFGASVRLRCQRRLIRKGLLCSAAAGCRRCRQQLPSGPASCAYGIEGDPAEPGAERV